MLLYNINYYYNNIYIRAQVYNNVENHDDCKTLKRQKRQTTKTTPFRIYRPKNALENISTCSRRSVKKYLEMLIFFLHMLNLTLIFANVNFNLSLT
jgi:hypothetical protein